MNYSYSAFNFIIIKILKPWGYFWFFKCRTYIWRIKNNPTVWVFWRLSNITTKPSTFVSTVWVVLKWMITSSTQNLLGWTSLSIKQNISIFQILVSMIVRMYGEHKSRVQWIFGSKMSTFKYKPNSGIRCTTPSPNTLYDIYCKLTTLMYNHVLIIWRRKCGIYSFFWSCCTTNLAEGAIDILITYIKHNENKQKLIKKLFKFICKFIFVWKCSSELITWLRDCEKTRGTVV